MNMTRPTGALLSNTGDFNMGVTSFLRRITDAGLVDCWLLPMAVPAGDSIAWVLIADKDAIERAVPVAPMMAVQGARALRSLTRRGEGTLRIGTVMKPCEIRAVTELIKLNQIDIERVTLITYDCPGAIPMRDYITNPAQSRQNYELSTSGNIWDDTVMKTECKICIGFAKAEADIHLALLGLPADSLACIPTSERGEAMLRDLNLACDTELLSWRDKVNELSDRKAKVREATYSTIDTMVNGISALRKTFARCIGCHNCQNACPICYCRQCFYDSEASQRPPDITWRMAANPGGVSLPSDTLLFHTGRMVHMSASCVGCGMCSDACPVNIPVGKLFTFVGEKTGASFAYHAGANRNDIPPLRDYRLIESSEITRLTGGAEPGENLHE